MIALVLAAVLVAPAIAAPPAPGGEPAAAPGDTALRVPGAWMRFGHTQEQVLARAPFTLTPAGGAAGSIARQGPASWFGIPGEATLSFRDDRLVRFKFVVKDAAPHWVDYARDQLRRSGYRPRWERNERGLEICTWEGAARVRLEIRDRLLSAEISAAGPPAPRGIVAVRAARLDTVPVFPAIFVLGRPAPEGVGAAPGLADSTPLLAPAYPPRARAAGVQGRVWVRALVDTSGAVEAAEIVRSIPELDSAAVAVARSCRFRPFEPAGTRVRFRVEIPVTFRVR